MDEVRCGRCLRVGPCVPMRVPFLRGGNSWVCYDCLPIWSDYTEAMFHWTGLRQELIDCGVENGER
jgi:hypothetical protein